MKYDNVLIQGVCCPFCKATEGKSLYTVTAAQSATHFVLPWHNAEKHKQLEKHIISLWHQDTCQLICCSSCAGVFCWPFVAGDKEFYDLAYERSGYPQNKWEFKKAVDWTSNNKSEFPDIKVLEIGAGDGAFLSKIIEIGINPENIEAIEYSDYGRNKLHELKISNVLTENIPSSYLFSKWQNKFDFIFMFQVLEHLGDLDTKLEFLRSCLRSQGKIIFAVPNPLATYFNEVNDALLDMPPNHISRFSEGAIKELAQRNLFEVKSIEFEPLDKLSRYKQFCQYKYLRSTQFRYTLASLVSQLPSKWKIRGICSRIYRQILLLVNIMYLTKIKYSSSQLVVLQKK